MSAHSGPSGAVNRCPPPDTTFVWISFSPRHLRALRCGVGGYY